MRFRFLTLAKSKAKKAIFRVIQSPWLTEVAGKSEDSLLTSKSDVTNLDKICKFVKIYYGGSWQNVTFP